EFAAPHSGGEELPGELAPVLARPVADLEARVEPDQVPCGADAQVEFPVLPSANRLVEEADLFEDLPAEHAEIRGFRRALRRSPVVARSAETELAVVCPGDGGLERGLASGEHHAADVGRAGAVEGVDGGPRVAGLEL